MFVQGYPVYPPKTVRFHFAARPEDLACTDEHCPGRTSTAVYPVQNNDSLQHFSLPPTLCAGGYVRVSPFRFSGYAETPLCRAAMHGKTCCQSNNAALSR